MKKTQAEGFASSSRGKTTVLETCSRKIKNTEAFTNIFNLTISRKICKSYVLFKISGCISKTINDSCFKFYFFINALLVANDFEVHTVNSSANLMVSSKTEHVHFMAHQITKSAVSIAARRNSGMPTDSHQLHYNYTFCNS